MAGPGSSPTGSPRRQNKQPGVAYSTLGPSFYAHRHSAASYSFSKEPLKERTEVSAYDTAGPGPCEYDWGEGIPHVTSGRTVTPSRNAYTDWASDSTSRSRLGLPAQPHTLPPGPGLYLRSGSSYHLTGSQQANTQWRNSTMAGWQAYCRRWGPVAAAPVVVLVLVVVVVVVVVAVRRGGRFRGHWECRTPMVVSREHERERLGVHSPGPMTAAPVDSVGRQLSSTRKTQPRCTFSRAGRFSNVPRRAAEEVPGPGAYNY
ncbi:hypothetical protein HYH02_009870 [Chlamydomonas schloesseri]|uniref:Uncharacterized protein n=1 Tax=Chlamydomonas schloesseri TaxID=2026947 RepID=A0A835W8X1_9CHLO|nr:hypothetical protein HYH02_009870 [Chlamydomonas schloesseri]|eukprot:KAG2442079.1 hypothetical protein HYH02_009870 [Chlamydomonas schloesseri]